MSVCIYSLSIAPCFRNCKRGQGNFLHFGRLDNFSRGNWAKWRKIGGIFLRLFLFASGGGLFLVCLFVCLRRVTFVNSDKSNQKRHSRGEGFRSFFASFPHFCLRRDTFFPERKYPKNGLRKGGFRFPPFLKNLFPLKRPKREGVRALPLWKHPPGGCGLPRPV